MTTPEEIISNDRLLYVHAFANFGAMTPREVVNDGVRKYAIGYTGGSTQLAILREHGLITKPNGISYRANLTEKGKAYARAIGLFEVTASVPTDTRLVTVAQLERWATEWADTCDAVEEDLGSVPFDRNYIAEICAIIRENDND